MKPKLISCLIGFAVCLLVYGLYVSGPRSLVAISTPVLKVGYTGTIAVRYWWLSEDRLLVLRYTPGMNSTVPDRGHFLLYDLKTRSETPLPALDPALSSTKSSADQLKLDRGMLFSNGKSWPLRVIPAAKPEPAEYKILDRPSPCDEEQGAVMVVEAERIGAPASESFHIKKPVQQQLRDIAFSNRGDKIAWAFSDPPSFSLKSYLDPLAMTYVICVSNIDGTHMQELGYITDRVGIMTSCSDYYVALAWLPGDRRICYECGGTLYVTSVD